MLPDCHCGADECGEDLGCSVPYIVAQDAIEGILDDWVALNRQHWGYLAYKPREPAIVPCRVPLWSHV